MYPHTCFEQQRQFHENIQNYPELLNKLYENFQKELKDTEEVRTEGRKLEEISRQGVYPEELTVSFILNLRLLEKNYMLFRSGNSLAAQRCDIVITDLKMRGIDGMKILEIVKREYTDIKVIVITGVGK